MKNALDIYAMIVIALSLFWIHGMPKEELDAKYCVINRRNVTVATVILPFRPVGCVIYKTMKSITTLVEEGR